jgi:hypothetical protein
MDDATIRDLEPRLKASPGERLEIGELLGVLLGALGRTLRPGPGS